MPITPYVNADTGDLLRRARRYLAQWQHIPPPSARIAGDSSPQLVHLLACHVERQDAEIVRLRAALNALVLRCDGEEGVRADGSNIDTCAAHAAIDEPTW